MRSPVFRFLFLFLLIHCSILGQESEIKIKDFRGKSISLQQPANRIVCLLESALSGLYMLQAKEQVCGVPAQVYQSHLIQYYSKLDERITNESLPAPGNWDFISLERIIASKPDIVILWASQSEDLQSIEACGIPVYAVEINSFNDLKKEITDLGKICGKQQRADTLLTYSQKIIQNLKTNISALSKDKSSAYFMWTQGLLESSGSSSTVQEMFNLSSINNIVQSPMEHVVINIENLIQWNPDLIFMWYNDRMDPQDVLNDPRLSLINAVKNKKVFELPSAFYCDFWTLKYIYVVHLISEWSYPELKENSELTKESIMLHLYGKNI